MGQTALTTKHEAEERKISLQRKSLDHLPPHHPDRYYQLNQLALMLQARFKQTGQASDLDEVILIYREALDLRPAPHPDYLDSLDNLAMALRNRFEQTKTGQLSDLDELVVILRQTLDLRPVPNSDRLSSLGYFAQVLDIRFNQTNQLSDLNEAILVHYEALDLQPASHPHRSFSLNNLAISLRTRFDRTHQLSDLDEAISKHRETLDILSEHLPRRPISLIQLAEVLHTRFDQTGQLVDLDEAIMMHREALDLQPVHNSERLSWLESLASALRTRYEQTHQPSDVGEVVSTLRKALDLRSVPNSDRSILLGHIASVLQFRFEHTRQLSHLDEVILIHREAFSLQPRDRPGHYISLTQLASALCTRCEQTYQRSDVDEAILLLRKAVDSRPVPHPDRSHLLSHLATALETRAEQTGQLSDVGEVVLTLREALDLRPAPHPDRSSLLSQIGSALHSQFEHSRKLSDLDNAISMHREALSLRPEQHLDHYISLGKLASALRTRCEQTRQRSDVDEAILLLQKALDLPPVPHPDRSFFLSYLAGALETRYEQMRQFSDLEEAVSMHRQALDLRPVDHPGRFFLLNNLAKALHTRYEQETGQPKDVDQAILLLREALELRPAPHPDRSFLLGNLASILQSRSEQMGHSSNLQEAISTHREALDLQPVPHPDRIISLNNLAKALHLLFKQTGQLSVVDEAITLCRQGVQLLPTDNPRVCNLSDILGECLLSRFNWTDDPGEAGIEPKARSEHISGAIDAFRAAVHCDSAPLPQRFIAARRWAQLLRDSDPFHASVLEAHEAAIGFVPRLTILGLDVESRHQILKSNIDGLARDAAACAIERQKIDKAIELLEAGRAIFWSQALQLRTPLNRLEIVEPVLAQRLKSISHALEQGALRDTSNKMSESQNKSMSMEQEAIHYRQLNDEWMTIVEEVRKLSTFQDFLRPKSFAVLSAAAEHGPVVILVASRQASRCDALIIRQSQDPMHVALPQFNPKTAEKLAWNIRDLSGTYAPTRSGDRHAHRRQDKAKVKDPDKAFQDILATLWKFVVQPILGALNLEKSDSPPRLWWLPTGQFASLPIHAAGIYDANESECASDYVISSYTPTLSALLIPPSITAEPFKMLAAIQIATKGYALLPYTEAELRKIEEHVPRESLIKFGTPGLPATVESILSAIPTTSIVHLACHGVQDLRNPLDSALLLENGHLKVSRLMELSMEKASLVFLSACQTALVGDSLPDEPIHLAATLLFAGFRGAIATMWSIRDNDGPPIADSFYRHLFSTPRSITRDPTNPLPPPDTTRAAHALHLAVTELRSKLHAERAPSRFVRWVPFIHMGL